MMTSNSIGGGKKSAATDKAAFARIAKLATGGKKDFAAHECEALLFGQTDEWRVYPNVLHSDLSPDQRKVLELAVDLELPMTVSRHGLPSDLARFIGRAPRGPSDVEIRVGGRDVPIWWAVSAVGSGHAKAEDVLAAWTRLPSADALAAFTEVAVGKAYDVLEAHAVEPKRWNYYAEPHQKLYRERVVSLLADASLSFGDEGERAARHLLKILPGKVRGAFVGGVPAYSGAAHALVALLAGGKHAKARKSTLDPAYDEAFVHLWERIAYDKFHSPKLIAAIKRLLPKERAAALGRAIEPPQE